MFRHKTRAISFVGSWNSAFALLPFSLGWGEMWLIISFRTFYLNPTPPKSICWSKWAWKKNLWSHYQRKLDVFVRRFLLAFLLEVAGMILSVGRFLGLPRWKHIIYLIVWLINCLFNVCTVFASLNWITIPIIESGQFAGLHLFMNAIFDRGL